MVIPMVIDAVFVCRPFFGLPTPRQTARAPENAALLEVGPGLAACSPLGEPCRPAIGQERFGTAKGCPDLREGVGIGPSQERASGPLARKAGWPSIQGFWRPGT